MREAACERMRNDSSPSGRRRRESPSVPLDRRRRVDDLGTFGGTKSFAYGVSADGNVIAGQALLETEQGHAFRWTAEYGLQDLRTLGGTGSVAYGISGDGNVVVGFSQHHNANAVVCMASA